MLRVMAAASAPLLIKVGSGRVRRGGSSSATGTPLKDGRGDADAETELEAGCVGLTILVEKIFETEEVGEIGEASDAVDVGLVVTVAVVEESVTCGGAIASTPRDVCV